MLLKRARNQKKNEQRNYCFQSFPASLVTLFVKWKDVTWLKTKKETNSNGSQFQSSFWKSYILIYNKSHVITQSKRNEVLTGIFKIYSKDEFTDNRESSLNPNHCSSPVFYYLNMKAHFNMLIDSDFSKQAHDN